MCGYSLEHNRLLLLQVSRSIKGVFDGAIGQYTPFHGKLEPTVTRKVGFALTIMLSDHADTLSVSVSGCSKNTQPYKMFVYSSIVQDTLQANIVLCVKCV